ncbi:MAG TPA: sulfotransferase family 2 domain-containing protein [Chryseolinea sp.]|nr:sulfotransferase family 2 domain-containing protein [Chryseolinea sp.]
MKLLRFVFLLIRRGSLFQEPIDFEAKRKTLVASLPISKVVVTPVIEGTTRSRLWKIPGLYTIMASISYFRDRHKMNRMYYVSGSHRVVYVRILKAAGTSVLTGFLRLMDNNLKTVSLTDEQVDALGYYFVKNEIPDSARSFERFAIVRDPYQRIVSVYLDLFDPSSSVFSYSAYWFGILDRAMSFKEFVRVISKVPISLLGPHFSPQYYILKELPDIKVFRIERDKTELTDLLARHDIVMGHRNKHGSDYDYRTYYDRETFELVKELYAGDVTRFGYMDEEDNLRKAISD